MWKEFVGTEDDRELRDSGAPGRHPTPVEPTVSEATKIAPALYLDRVDHMSGQIKNLIARIQADESLVWTEDGPALLRIVQLLDRNLESANVFQKHRHPVVLGQTLAIAHEYGFDEKRQTPAQEHAMITATVDLYYKVLDLGRLELLRLPREG